MQKITPQYKKNIIKDNLLKKRRAAAIPEYGLIGSLIAVAAITSITLFGVSIENAFCKTQLMIKYPSMSSAIATCASRNVLNSYGLEPNADFSEIYQKTGEVAGAAGAIAQYAYSNAGFLESLGLTQSDLSNPNMSTMAWNSCYNKYSGGLAYACAITSAQAAATYKEGGVTSSGWGGNQIK